MRKDILERVTRFYKERLAFYRQLREEGLAKAREVDEVVAIENELKNTKMLALEGKLTPELDARYEELRARYKELVSSYIPTINYECPLCKDKGVVNGKYCKCLVNRYTEELKKIANVDSLPTFRFEDSTIDGYQLSDEDMARYHKIYDRMTSFANDFPNVERRNIFLRGQSGTGKTCLISAIANRLIERGVQAQYITAFDLSELMLASHLDYKNNSLSYITSADVLIIDDLGSEPMRENINKTYLQSILDSRISHTRSTIVTTNLSVEQLMKRYGERIISRLTNSNTTMCIDMQLPNLRMTKK